MIKFMMAFALLASSVAAQARDITITHFDQITERSIVSAGDYVWSDISQTSDNVTIDVNLTTQMAYVKRGGVLIGATNVSSGRSGFDTPEGTFKIWGKEDNHWSKKYKADMPYTMWVTTDGVALHSGSTPGRTTSHGCVHLPHEFAELLYSVVNKGAVVTIRKSRPQDSLILKLSE